MNTRTCPWWAAYLFDNPLRKLLHKPEKVVGKYLQAGMTALDVGCGMGYFSIGMAKIVGEDGNVIAADLQPQMLSILSKRAKRAGVLNRIKTVLCKTDSIEVVDKVDFALVFWMAHEVADREGFFYQLSKILNTGGKVLLAEPIGHVTLEDFKEVVGSSESAGFKVVEERSIRFSRGVLLDMQK